MVSNCLGNRLAQEYSFYDVRVVERKRPVTVLTVFTGDPSHKVRDPVLLSPSCSPNRLLDHCYSFEPDVVVIASRDPPRMGESHSPASARRRTSEGGSYKGLLDVLPLNDVCAADGQGAGHGDFTGQLSLRFHYRPHTERKLSRSSRAALCEHKRSADGLQWTKRFDTRRTKANMNTLPMLRSLTFI